MPQAAHAILLLALTGAPPPAGAPPAVVGQLLACRTIADSAARLACFDQQAGTLAAAQQSGEVVMMDRKQVRATRRSLFGLALPNLGVFGDDSIDSSTGVLETTIASARQGAGGKWTFDLAEGGRWVQLDNREFIVDPAAGQPIRIRRAAMGSYLANVNKQVAIRIERVR